MKITKNLKHNCISCSNIAKNYHYQYLCSGLRETYV